MFFSFTPALLWVMTLEQHHKYTPGTQWFLRNSLNPETVDWTALIVRGHVGRRFARIPGLTGVAVALVKQPVTTPSSSGRQTTPLLPGPSHSKTHLRNKIVSTCLVHMFVWYAYSQDTECAYDSLVQSHCVFRVLSIVCNFVLAK